MQERFKFIETDGIWAVFEFEETDKSSSIRAYGSEKAVKRLNELYNETKELEEKLKEREFELKELHSAYRDLEKIVDDNYEEFEKRFAKKQKEETIKTLERMLDDLRRE